MNEFEIIVSAVDEATAVLADIGKAVEGVGSAAQTAGEEASDALSQVSEAARRAAEGAQAAAQDTGAAMGGIKDSAKQSGQESEQAQRSAWDNIRTTISSAVDHIKGAVGGGFDGLKSVVGLALQGVGAVAQMAFEGIKTAAGAVFGALPGIASAGISGLTNAVKGSIDAALNWDNTMDDLQSRLGLTAEQAAGLTIAVERGGGNVEMITGQMMRLTNGLQNAKGELGPSGEALKALGVSAFEAGEKISTTGTKLPAGKLAEMNEKLATSRARLHDMEAAFAKSKSPTESQSLALERQRKAVADLSAAVADGGSVITKNLTKQGPMKDSATLLAEIATKIDAMPPGLEKTKAQMAIFGRSGKDMDDVLHQLANGGMDRATKMAKDLGLVIDDNQADAYAENMTDLNTMFKAVAINVGNQLLPVLVPVLGHLGQMGMVIIPQVIAAIRPMIDRFGELAKNVMPLLYTAFGKIWDAAQPMLGVLINIVTSALPPLLEGVGWLADLLITTIPGAVTVGSGAFAVLSQAVGDVVNWVTANWPAFYATISSVFAQVVAEISAVAVPVFNALVSIVGNVVNAVVEHWPQIQGAIAAVVAEVVSLFNAMLVPAFNVVRDAVVFVVEWIAANWPRVQQTIETAVSAIVALFVTVLTPAWEVLRDAVQQVVDWFVANLPLIEQTFSVVFGAIVTVVTSVIDTISGYIMLALPTIKTVFADVFGGVRAIVTSALTVIGGILKAAMQLITGDTKGALQTVKDSFTSAFAGIQKWLEDLVPRMVKLGTDIMNGLIKGLQDAGERVKGFLIALVKSALGKLADYLGIASPSKAMAWYGSMMVAGLTKGITDSTTQAVNAAAGLAGAVSAPLGSIGVGAPSSGSSPESSARDAAADATSAMVRSGAAKQPVVINLTVNGQTLATVVHDLFAPQVQSNIRRSYGA